MFHWKWSNNLNSWSWSYAEADRPNIDITELSSSTNEGQLTIEITVEGEIENSDDVYYWGHFNTSDTNYILSYNNGSGQFIGFSTTGGSEGNVSAAGDTITATIDLVSSDTAVSFWAQTGEGFETASQQNEWWSDWAPQDYAPDIDDGNGGNGDDDGDGTPGFTVLLALGAMGAVLVVLGRRRR